MTEPLYNFQQIDNADKLPWKYPLRIYKHKSFDRLTKCKETAPCCPGLT